MITARRLVLLAVVSAVALTTSASIAESALACGGSPRDAVVRHYRAIDQGRFPAAWSCLRTATRHAFGGYAKWRSGYRDTAWTRLQSAVTTDQAAGLAHVSFSLLSCGHAGGRAVTERFRGTWFAEDGPAGWRIGQPRVAVIRRTPGRSC